MHITQVVCMRITQVGEHAGALFMSTWVFGTQAGSCNSGSNSNHMAAATAALATEPVAGAVAVQAEQQQHVQQHRFQANAGATAMDPVLGESYGSGLVREDNHAIAVDSGRTMGISC